MPDRRGYCDVRQLVTVPPATRIVHIWRHFAVLTVKPLLGHIRDHLFLGREGYRIWKSWKFKDVYSGGFFETGSMPGLMTFYDDTPEYGLTLRYITLNLAHIGPRAASECEEPGCAEGQGSGLECPGGRRNSYLGTGWALAIPM